MKTKEECIPLIHDLFDKFVLSICGCGNVIGVFKQIDKDYNSKELVIVDSKGLRYEYYCEYYEFLIESN